MEDAANTVGQAIRCWRRKKRWSIQELAHRAGCSQSYLSVVERGRKSPTVAFLEKVVRAMDVPLRSLIPARNGRIDELNALLEEACEASTRMEMASGRVRSLLVRAQACLQEDKKCGPVDSPQ